MITLPRECIALSFIVTLISISEAFSQNTYKVCLASIKTDLDRITSEIKLLQAQNVVYAGTPNPTHPGVCTKLVARLHGSLYAAVRTNPLQAAHWNKISCLELDRLFLRQKCRCAEFHLEVSREDAAISRFLDARKRFDAVAALTRRRGIHNDAIRQWGNEASKIRDCWHDKATIILEGSTSLIDAALSER